MSYIAILLEATSLSDLLARMDMVGEVIAYNKQVQADMTAAREKVETVKAELEDARTELQDKQSELETKQVALQQKVAEANSLLASLESDINAYKSSRKTSSRRPTSRSRICAARSSSSNSKTRIMTRAKPTAPPAP